MTERRLSDEDIERLALLIDSPEREKKTYVFKLCREAADALRQLLSEVRALREETEPCDHSEVEEAGAIWWRCVICQKYIDRNEYPEPSEIPPGVGQ